MTYILNTSEICRLSVVSRSLDSHIVNTLEFYLVMLIMARKSLNELSVKQKLKVLQYARVNSERKTFPRLQLIT